MGQDHRSEAGSWAELVAAPTSRLGVIPDDVTFVQAAALPLAGLTTLRAIEKGGFLLHRRVLITASTGGVGFFAVQTRPQKRCVQRLS
jgi:NADPH2:quinone reductase